MRFMLIRGLYKAKKMLVETDESVTDAGYDCGYTDTAYFIRQFRSREEVSPGASEKRCANRRLPAI